MAILDVYSKKEARYVFSRLIPEETDSKMPPFSTEALILRSVDFQERDRLITFYSDQLGKMRGVAKGAKRSKKRFGSNLDLLAHVRVQGFERMNQDLVLIEGADLLEYFEAIRQELRTFARACYLAEWTEGCTADRQPHHGLLPLLLRILAILEQGKGGEGLLRIFEIKVLDLTGYGPRLDCCASCGRPVKAAGKVVIHVGRGGTVCESCIGGVHQGMLVSLGTVRILQDARSVTLDRLHRIAFSLEALKESSALLRAFFTYHVGRQLKSTSFLETVESDQMQAGR
jgi:DNA repair protein RecO (recombination protein O)